MVADLGNSRLKWGVVTGFGRVELTRALPLDALSAWDSAWAECGLDPASTWLVASVNPPAASRFEAWLDGRGVGRDAVRVLRSAADAAVPSRLEHPNATGVDRALAVRSACARRAAGRAAVVVMCGTAITVELIDETGVWQGGAIAPGLISMARGLVESTAQLPLASCDEVPEALGRATREALAAGVFWSAVGAIRELVGRQTRGLAHPPSIFLSGGDASRLAPWLDLKDAVVAPDLVLEGLSTLLLL